MFVWICLQLLSRISYCTADKMHDKVFAYIVQSQQNETLECHAFLCTKRKVVSLCVCVRALWGVGGISQACVFMSVKKR